MKDQLKKEFEKEYGVKHYQVCEGEKCVCRKVLLGLIDKAYKKGREDERKEESYKHIEENFGDVLEEMSKE
jgi:hypothetical protein